MKNVLETLEEACRAAGKISLPRQGNVEIAVVKSAGDYATTSDIDAGTTMTAIINEQLPDIPIVPEENKTDQVDEQFWAERQAMLDNGTFILMDDLDATVRYRHGGEDWGHILGLVQNNVLTHCAMFMPARDVMVLAELDKGCFVNGTQVRLNPDLKVQDSLLCMTVHKDVDLAFHRDVVTPIVYSVGPGGYVCFNSNIGGVVRLVQGELGGFIGCGHNWDFVGALAVQEASGIALSPTGQELNWNKIPMVMVAAANRQIANAMLAHTRAYLHYQEHFWGNPKFQS